jgi:hypothetical protein
LAGIFLVARLRGPRPGAFMSELARNAILENQNAGARRGGETGDLACTRSEDPELGVLMELEVGHGETEVRAGVQA